MIRRFSLALGLATVLAVPAAAQVPLLDVRVGAHAIMPTGGLTDNYKPGFGAYGRLGVPLGMMKLMGTLTYNQFPGKTVGIFTVDDESVIGLSVGPHLSLPLVDAGLELGYMSNFEKMSLIPSVSVGLGKLDVMAAYTLVNDDPKAKWFSLGVGLRF